MCELLERAYEVLPEAAGLLDAYGTPLSRRLSGEGRWNPRAAPDLNLRRGTKPSPSPCRPPAEPRREG